MIPIQTILDVVHDRLIIIDNHAIQETIGNVDESAKYIGQHTVSKISKTIPYSWKPLQVKY